MATSRGRWRRHSFLSAWPATGMRGRSSRRDDVKIAQRFNAGFGMISTARVPKGRLNIRQEFSRPFGTLGSKATLTQHWKCWAIFRSSLRDERQRRFMKKRFPRFSLRALVIAVLALAVCWTLTATWGVNTVFAGIPHTKEWRGNVLRAERRDDDGSLYVWDSQATAIFPFIIREQIRAQMPSGFPWEDQRTWFGFFGYYCEIHQPREALRKK
jgi:hypothetical protein